MGYYQPSNCLILRIPFFLFLALFVSQVSKAQDSTSVSLRRNTIKIDLTGKLIYSNNLNFSFERVVKQNQSCVFTLGYQEFPRIVNYGENIVSKKEDNKGGYKVGGEYRFYLKKENKFAAPRGVYIGPYVTAIGFKTDRKITYSGGDMPEEAELKSSFNILNFGAQVGY